jgi:hypothetical protein
MPTPVLTVLMAKMNQLTFGRLLLTLFACRLLATPKQKKKED